VRWNQRIQLFCKNEKSHKSCVCYVDAVVLLNEQVKVIVEIEESDIRPVHLCGKVFVSALATHFIHRQDCYRMADRVFFVQVIDTSSKSETASKLPQCRNLEPLIQGFLRAGNVNIQYDIFYGGISQFECAEESDQQDLVEHIRQAVTHA